MEGGQNEYVDPWSIVRDLSQLAKRLGSAELEVEVRRPNYREGL